MRLRGGIRPQEQLELALDFAGCPGGVGEPLRSSRVSESPVGTESLMEEVCELGNMVRALGRVVSNGGSAGIDGMTAEDLRDGFEREWPGVREALLAGRYRPKPVRRAEIPKPGGGTRKLGIPTVWDRTIQQAVLQVLQPRWDPSFSDASYGFRPGRTAHDAIARARSYVSEGYTWVVDIDLERFFDRVHHDRLMAEVARKVRDKRLLKLIRGYLTAGVLEDGLVSRTEEGTPQGGPLSPLLSNLVLDELDRELASRGLKFVRYADDCNIYVRSERAARRVMCGVSRFITKRLRLRVNSEKSAVGRPWERKFLGFNIGTGKAARVRIADSSIERFRFRVRGLTRRCRGISAERLASDLASLLRGWAGYYGITEWPKQLEELDGWIRHRVRSYIWSQWKTGQRRYRELTRRGISTYRARQAAATHRGPWHVSALSTVNKALSSARLAELGLPSLGSLRST